MPKLIGMSINFAVMFRLKFRFSNRVGLLTCCAVLMVCTWICAHTHNVPLLVATCFIAGWFRMWATFVCNSTIQLWITPVRDMAIFFCYVYLIVDGVIQVSGVATIYTAFYSQWEYMHWIIIGLLALAMIMVLLFVKPFKGMPQIPLLGIDWIWSLVCGAFFYDVLCFLYVSTVFFMTGGMLLKYAEPYCLVLYVSLSTCGEQRFFIILIYPSRL